MTNQQVQQKSIVYRLGSAIDTSLFYATGFCVSMILMGVIGLPTLWAALAAIAMMTVRQGLSFSIVMAGISALIVFVISHYAFMPLLPILVTLLAAEMYRRGCSIILIYECLTLGIMAAIIILHIAYPDVAAWWLNYYAPIQKMMLADKSLDQAVIKSSFIKLSEMATGLAGMSFISMAMIGLVLGLLWSDKLTGSRQTIKELLEVRISLVLLIVSAFGVLAWFIRFKWMVDILPVIIGAIALYGMLVLLCITWYLFARSVWVYIMLFSVIFLFINFSAAKAGLLLLAVTDYFADWRSIFKRVSTAKPE